MMLETSFKSTSKKVDIFGQWSICFKHILEKMDVQKQKNHAVARSNLGVAFMANDQVSRRTVLQSKSTCKAGNVYVVKGLYGDIVSRKYPFRASDGF